MVMVNVPLDLYDVLMSNHDFDFIFGNWKIHNRRLKEPLAGSSEWLEFDATYFARPVWGGLANIDEFEALEKAAYDLGFESVAAGPLVRSSYHADQNLPEGKRADSLTG